MKSDVYIKHVADSLNGYSTIKTEQDKRVELYILRELLLATVAAIDKDLTL